VTESTNCRLDIIARLRQTTGDLAWTVRNVPHMDLITRQRDDEWSIHEHLAHLRDMEQEVLLPLLRWATVPDMLDPLDYNRRQWHEQRYRLEEPALDIVNDILRIRDEELSIFREMSETTWSAWREDTRWGPLTCQWIAETMYRHILDHLQGIMAVRADLHLAALQPRPLVAGGYIGGRGRA
jgi:hypothetical protein